MSRDDLPRIIDRFAGPGGWDEGARMIGRTDVVGIEWDAAACATAEANGHRRVGPGPDGDVSLIDPLRFVDEHLGGEQPEGGIDSPPCQPFSAAGKGLGRLDVQLILDAVDRIGSGTAPAVAIKALRDVVHDDKSPLALEPLRWAIDLESEWLAWEQVPAVLPLWEACAAVLREDGYHVVTGTVHAEQYGVPQTRKRAVLLARRSAPVALPVPTHSRYYPRTPDKLDPGVAPWVTMADALGGWGMTRRPSFTVTGGGASTGGAEPFASTSRRAMLAEFAAGRWLGDAGAVRPSARNAGILQSFPWDYAWCGTEGQRSQQAGNAVPPLLAAHLLAAVGAGSFPAVTR